ncbi:uncharacterized protein LOC117332487 isoform X2 [Pecten maximus]|uniref:uncharacterized protein LOC117332487 isoform X2 n=1 Tax=Pecten maximus TaxID=6579 RepID=UPI0014590F99|nr:uncharacterized protein LOC117332487 isoform X2 [Pecten maximus]
MEALMLVILVTQIIGVFSQVIPASRTKEICSGSRMVLKFDEVTYTPGNIVSWHFIPAGGSEEEDVGLVRTSQKVTAVGKFENHTLERVGDLGMALSDVRISDSGLYRVSQNPNLRYKVTVKDPCLNSSMVASQGVKQCAEIHCQTRSTFLRFEVEGDTEQITENPNTFCALSVTNVTCFVEVNGQELSNSITVDLKPDDDDENYDKNSEGLGTGATVGLIIGMIVIVAIMGGLGYVVWKRANNSKGFINP